MAAEQANKGFCLPISSNSSMQKNTESAVLVFLRPGLGNLTPSIDSIKLVTTPFHLTLIPRNNSYRSHIHITIAMGSFFNILYHLSIAFSNTIMATEKPAGQFAMGLPASFSRLNQRIPLDIA